jgi:hypothetical protein
VILTKVTRRYQCQNRAVTGEHIVLWTIIAILLVLWLLGLIGNIGGGLIHILLVIAIIVFIFRMISGRRSV